jgi:hypothetical protein
LGGAKFTRARITGDKVGDDRTGTLWSLGRWRNDLECHKRFQHVNEQDQGPLLSPDSCGCVTVVPSIIILSIELEYCKETLI